MEGAEHHGECEFVGEGMADIAGIGILVGFIGQAFLSLCLATWVFFLSKHGSLEMHHEEGTAENQIERKRLQFISEMLVVGNDIQMTLGISYMVTVFASVHTIDLYHLHLVFDIVSFVGVSNAAAMVCWTYCAAKLAGKDVKPGRTKPERAYFTGRHRVSYMYAALFVALTILLGIRLGEWSPDAEPGRCYHSTLIATAGSSHPSTDKTYVGITASWMLVSMGMAIFLSAHRRRWVFLTALLQFPVHLYMALALRSENQGKLSGEEKHENGWDFGQTTAVVLLGVAFGELYVKAREYVSFEHDVRKNGPRNADGKRKCSALCTEDPEDARQSVELREQEPLTSESVNAAPHRRSASSVDH